MRVLFLTPNFPNPSDPAKGMANYYTARALARLRHAVVVIAPFPWPKRRQLGTARAVPRVRYVDGIEIHHPRYVYPPGLFRETYGWFLWHSIRRLAAGVVDRLRPDVVFAAWIHPDGDCALRLAARANVPAVMWSGGLDVLVLPRDSARRRCIAGVLKRSDTVVCVSEHLKDAIVRLGVATANVQVVRNGIDTDVFRPGDRREARQRLNLPTDGRVVLYVGWLVPIKGVDVLVDACGTLLADGLDFRLCLVGEGPLRQALEARAAKAGMKDRVTFVGAVPHDALADWYRAADLTVLPSHSEGVPNVLYESISCGTPFVASNVGGIPEIADPGLDRLVPPGDTRALASAIRDRLSAEGDAPRAVVPGSWEDHARHLEAVFRDAMAVKAAESRAASRTPPAG